MSFAQSIVNQFLNCIALPQVDKSRELDETYIGLPPENSDLKVGTHVPQGSFDKLLPRVLEPEDMLVD